MKTSQQSTLRPTSSSLSKTNHSKLSYEDFTVIHQIHTRTTSKEGLWKFLRFQFYPSNPFKEYPYMAMDHQVYRNKPPRKGVWTIKSIAIDYPNKGLWTIRCSSLILVENPRITLSLLGLDDLQVSSDLTYFKKIILSFNHHLTTPCFRRICLLLP